MKRGSIRLVVARLMCLTAAGAERPLPEAAHSHWAFQPLNVVSPPGVAQASWTRNSVDRFLLAAMESHGLSPAPAATPEQLLRRVWLDLTGLPPTPDEFDALAHSAAPDQYERVVDRLLSSPQYGERWARHWLDLVRYAESDGFEHDVARPNTWRYRDYVIASFNQDKPYDQFLLEQIAGDELWPDRPEALIATGFNLLGPDMVDSADQVQRRLNTLNDMTDTAASVVLSLTLSCARCHDHKFEPFTQRDYFRLQAFFAPAEFQREHPVPTAREKAIHEESMALYDQQTHALREAIAQLDSPYRQRLWEAKLGLLSEDAQLAHRTPKDQRTKEQEGTVQETAHMVEVTESEVEKAMSIADRARRKSLLEALNRVPKPAVLPRAMVLQRTASATPPTFVLARGDHAQPREQVEPGVPEVLLRGVQGLDSRPLNRRTDLARWLANPDNPLTARVMVNRIWQHHFGRGLVPTPSDFGTRGEAPSHPELLDWLAREFIRNGWSVKTMHRLILTSSAYRQSSVADAATVARDPENRWFTRQNRWRMEGEAIRDSLLFISGQLNAALGGPSVQPPIPLDLARTSKSWIADVKVADHERRSIYVFSRRNLRFPFLEVFDGPDSNLSCPERGRSTTAPQALTLLNSAEAMAAAAATARRVSCAASLPARQIELGYRLILGRRPTAREEALAEEFLRDSWRRLSADGDAEAQRAAEAALTEFCRALFNLNSFVYVE